MESFIPSKQDDRIDALFRKYVDLSHPRLGTEAIACSDDFFAPMARMLDPQPAIFVPDKYDDNGKWMDGWESRRKRIKGHDWCVIRLGAPGQIHAVNIDTSHFTGNFAPAISLEAWTGEDNPGDSATWTMLIEETKMQGNSHHPIEISNTDVWTHLRLNIFPDGGVARLRVFGTIHKDWSKIGTDEVVDLVAQVNGGTGVAWNDAHFGVPANMIAPGSGVNMGDGWETARRRVPGNDWSILKLGHAGVVEKILINTDFFKGNFPDRCSLRGGYIEGYLSEDELQVASENWPLLLDDTKLSADADHWFEAQDHKPITHVRLDIFPDGGVSRLRLMGKKTP
ncbi:MAG: allantoicase [Rhizobiaceae bacterium]